MNKFMKIAIKEAKKGVILNHGGPFGAVIVRNGKIISKAYNTVLKTNDPTAHAEITAIRNACKKLKTRKLNNCILYTTCEPCTMCFYMAWITGVSKIVYGTTLEDSIKIGSEEIKVNAKELNEKSGNKIEIVSNFLRDECLELFK